MVDRSYDVKMADLKRPIGQSLAKMTTETTTEMTTETTAKPEFLFCRVKTADHVKMAVHVITAEKVYQVDHCC